MTLTNKNTYVQWKLGAVFLCILVGTVFFSQLLVIPMRMFLNIPTAYEPFIITILVLYVWWQGKQPGSGGVPNLRIGDRVPQIVLTLLTFTALFGLALLKGVPIIEAIKSGRSYFFLWILMVLYPWLRMIRYDHLYFVAVGSLVGGIIYSYVGWEQRYTHRGTITENLFMAPLVSMFIICIMPFVAPRHKRIQLAIIAIITCAIAIYHSYFRINILVFFLSICLGVSYSIAKSRSMGGFLLVSCVGVIAVAAGIFSLQMLDGGDEGSQRDRMVGRMVQLYYGENLSDQHRMNQVREALALIVENPLPNGIPIRNPMITGRGIFKDVPLYELLYTFGSIVGVPLFIFIIVWGLRCFSLGLTSRKGPVYNLSSVFVFLLLPLFFLNGHFFIISYELFFTSVMFSYIFLPANGLGRSISGAPPQISGSGRYCQRTIAFRRGIFPPPHPNRVY